MRGKGVRPHLLFSPLLDAADSDIGLPLRWDARDGPFTLTARGQPSHQPLSPCRAACAAARRSESASTASSPSSPGPGRLRPPGRPGRAPGTTAGSCASGRRVLSSTAGWCSAYAGGGIQVQRRTTSGCGWRSWQTARRRWRSTKPQPRAVGPPAGASAPVQPAAPL